MSHVRRHVASCALALFTSLLATSFANAQYMQYAGQMPGMMNPYAMSPYAQAYYGQPQYGPAHQAQPFVHASHTGGYYEAIDGKSAGLMDDCCGSCDGCSGCGKGGCGTSGCGCKQRAATWIAGVEATFLTADIKGPASVIAISDDTQTQQLTTRVDAGAVDEVYFAPRIWGGFQGCVWGVTGRYWKFQESESYVGDGGGGSYAALANSADFNAYTVDLELTRLIERKCCSMIVAVGGRYAEVETSALATGSNDFNPGDPEGFASAFALSSNDFKGGGVTTGISGRRPIGQSKWNMFWNVRGSVLWGDAESFAAATALVNEASSTVEALGTNDSQTSSASNAASGSGNTNSNANADAVNDDRETLIIGEVQIGLECNKQFQCFPGTGFFRIAGEYQYWDIPGGSATAQAQASDAGAISLGIGQATDVEAQLYGMSVSAGLSY